LKEIKEGEEEEEKKRIVWREKREIEQNIEIKK
jgi:hypothetical protein